MNNEITVSAIGSDERLYYAAKYLEKQKFKVSLYQCAIPPNGDLLNTRGSLEQAFEARVLLFGLPVTKDLKTVFMPAGDKTLTLNDCISLIKPNQTVLGGQLPTEFYTQLREKNAYCRDYFLLEEFILKNARITAEGVAQILLQALPMAVFTMRLAVFGFGRVGFYTALLLKSMGAEITVFVRAPVQKTKAEALGLKAYFYPEFSVTQNGFHAIINTVPANVLTKAQLELIPNTCYYIEAAGKPFGIPKAEIKRLGINDLPASSLPGKTAPLTAGYAIAQTAESILREVNLCPR